MASKKALLFLRTHLLNREHMRCWRFGATTRREKRAYPLWICKGRPTPAPRQISATLRAELWHATGGVASQSQNSSLCSIVAPCQPHATAQRSRFLFRRWVLCLVVLPVSLLAETADDYAHRGAQKYIFGDTPGAKAEVATGLAKFPNDKELQEMSKLFLESKKNSQSKDKNQQQQNSGNQDQQQQSSSDQNQDQQNQNQQNQDQNQNQQSQNNNQNNRNDQKQDNRDQSQAKNDRQPNQQQGNQGQTPTPTPNTESSTPSPTPSPGDHDKNNKNNPGPSPEDKPPGSSPTPGNEKDNGAPTPSPSPGEGQGEGGQEPSPSPGPSGSPQKKFAGEIKGAPQNQSPAPEGSPDAVEVEPDKEGEMTAAQARALLESMKDEEARVQLDERRAARRVYRDW